MYGTSTQQCPDVSGANRRASGTSGRLPRLDGCPPGGSGRRSALLRSHTGTVLLEYPDQVVQGDRAVIRRSQP